MTKTERRKRAAQNRRKQRKGYVPGKPASSVAGGFRAGKRKRGNSLIKLKPRETVTAQRATVTDEHGAIVAENVTMITYKPAS